MDKWLFLGDTKIRIDMMEKIFNNEPSKMSGIEIFYAVIFIATLLFIWSMLDRMSIGNKLDVIEVNKDNIINQESNVVRVKVIKNKEI